MENLWDVIRGLTTKTMDGPILEDKKEKAVIMEDKEPKKEEEVIVRKMSDERLCFLAYLM